MEGKGEGFEMVEIKVSVCVCVCVCGGGLKDEMGEIEGKVGGGSLKVRYGVGWGELKTRWGEGEGKGGEMDPPPPPHQASLSGSLPPGALLGPYV